MDQEYLQIIRLNCGSKQAFTAIYNKYVGRIFNYVCAMTRDEVLAEDITQFCFMKLWERRKEIRPDENFAAYLYVIARNAVYKETRRLVTSAQLHRLPHPCLGHRSEQHAGGCQLQPAEEQDGSGDRPAARLAEADLPHELRAAYDQRGDRPRTEHLAEDRGDAVEPRRSGPAQASGAFHLKIITKNGFPCKE